MNAALRLSWYKFKHHYMDFVKVLLGIVAFEGLILYIQDKGFLKDFETTRMTLFLLLFSTSLLIVVQNSIYISKERSVLNRDFFSGLSRSTFALLVWGFTPSLLFWKPLSLSYLTLSLVSSLTRNFQTLVIIFGSYRWEVGITVLLVFLASHFIALFISALVGKSEITSVILAVVVGIMHFRCRELSCLCQKPLIGYKNLSNLGYGHKLFGISSDLSDLPSSLAKYGVPVPKSQLEAFQGSTGKFWGQWWALVLHCLVYALLFFVTLQKKEK